LTSSFSAGVSSRRIVRQPGGNTRLQRRELIGQGATFRWPKLLFEVSRSEQPAVGSVGVPGAGVDDAGMQEKTCVLGTGSQRKAAKIDSVRHLASGKQRPGMSVEGVNVPADSEFLAR
jgi:hypothetical protein